MAQNIAETAILRTVYSIARALDDLDADLLEKQFNALLILDVSGHIKALPAQELTPQRLSEQMFRVLAGFDATQHAISNPTVVLDPENATAVAVVYFNAYHCLQRDEYKIDSILARGRWELEVSQSEGRWLVNKIRIIRTIPLQVNELALYDESVARVKDGKARRGVSISKTA